MKKLTVIGHCQTYEFGIDNIKWCYFRNLKYKHDFMESLRSINLKSSLSDYAVENDKQRNVLLENINLSVKNTLFYEVTPRTDLEDSKKLRVNTIFYEYLVEALEQPAFQEIIQTIQVLLEELTTELDEALNFDESENMISLETNFSELGGKTLVKMLELGFLKNECTMSTGDATYIELVSLKINMIIKIARQKPLKNIIVLLNLDDRMNVQVSKNMPPNLYLIATYKPKTVTNVKDVYLEQRDFFDLADETDVYHRITLYLPKTMTLDETYSYLSNFLNRPVNEINLIP